MAFPVPYSDFNGIYDYVQNMYWKRIAYNISIGIGFAVGYKIAYSIIERIWKKIIYIIIINWFKN